MRILVAHNRYQYRGGEDSVVDAELAMLRRAGHDVLLVEAHNAAIDTLPSQLSAAASLFGSAARHREMTQHIRAFQPDVLHLHNWFPLLSPSVIHAAADAAVPVVQTLHNFRMICAGANLYRDGRPCLECVGKRFPIAATRHACYRDSHAGSAVVSAAFAFHRHAHTWDSVHTFIAVSEAQRNLLIEGGIPAGKLVVKPNTVATPATLTRAPRGLHALFAGRLTEDKGILTLLAACESGKMPCAVHIAGDGPLATTVRAAAIRLPGLRYLGQLDPAALRAEMASCRFLLFPSQCIETFALSILEAFAVGTPVLASRQPSVQELVSDGQTGLTFTAGDVPDLLRKATVVCNDEALHTTLQRNCRALFDSTYTEAQNCAQLLAIYRNAIASPASVTPFNNSHRSARTTPQTGSDSSMPPHTTLPAADESPAVSTPWSTAHPPVANVLGVGVHVVDMPQTVALMEHALRNREKGYICLMNAFGVLETRRHEDLRDVAANAFLVLPDGTPTVWMGHHQGHSAMQRVFGPDLMLEILKREDLAHLNHFFCGGAPGVADQLRDNMLRRFPWLQISGTFTPPFRAMTRSEEAELLDQVELARPDIIWVGISTPKQDRFMFRYLPLLDTTLMVGVGAAFLYHTGAIADSPAWVKRAGLQWLHRLVQEPTRLWRRYGSTVPQFMVHAALQLSGLREYPLSPNTATAPLPQAVGDAVSPR